MVRIRNNRVEVPIRNSCVELLSIFILEVPASTLAVLGERQS